ncbi:hypothetical protein VTN77DRAFT_4493 [Rasamsonia byssochlamydoides]|uniref:uncharacterized protein n=1 Tax=Rasamsonia byssochlamydoides TaxID=89139 RepID=UPI0037436210
MECSGFVLDELGVRDSRMIAWPMDAADWCDMQISQIRHATITANRQGEHEGDQLLVTPLGIAPNTTLDSESLDVGEATRLFRME